MLGKMSMFRLDRRLSTCILVVFFTLICLSGCNSSNRGFSLLSHNEKQRLEDALKFLFQTSTFGYVLCGEKPMYLGGYRYMSKEEAETDYDLNYHVQMTQTQHVFDKLSFRNKNFIFILKDTDIPKFKGKGKVLILINRKALLKTIQENLSLFQERFGKEFTSSDVLETIISKGFYECFVGRQGLQGIVLGYGKENAFACEKMISFFNEFDRHCKSNQIHFTKDQADEEYKMMIQYMEDHLERWGHFIGDYKRFINYKGDDVMIPFGYLEGTEESEKLLKDYNEYAKKSSKLLYDKNFLKKTLKKLNS